MSRTHSAIIVNLTRDQHRQLKRDAANLHVTVSDLVRAKCLGLPARGIVWVDAGHWEVAGLGKEAGEARQETPEGRLRRSIERAKDEEPIDLGSFASHADT
jgi:hypothetical protein